MKNLSLAVFIVTGVLLSQITLAHCLRSDEVILETKINKVGACEKQSPILDQGYFNYRNLSNNPYLVKYWVGGYVKRIEYKEKVLRVIYDDCSTSHHGKIIRKIISKETLYRTNQSQKNFPIDNPNLDVNVAASYELVPLAESELDEVMSSLKDECAQYLRVQTATMKTSFEN